MPTNNAHTVLALTGIGVQPYSARGLSQTLTPIQQSQQMRRTVNGKLVDISLEQFRQYQSTITGTDQEPPACDGVWPGKLVTVDCIAELSHAIGATPLREVVEDSPRDSGGFTIYRPRLTMRVVTWDITRDEYGHTTQWSMTLEEAAPPAPAP